MFLEPKALYNSPVAATPIPDDLSSVCKARIRKRGNDLTVVTYGNTTHMVLKVAEKLANEGKQIEVIDIRSIIPDMGYNTSGL